MAVENKWVNAEVAAGKKGNAAKVAGGKLLCVAFKFEVAAADDDGSIYKLAKLPSNAIPVKCELFSDAITSGTDYDLGLYKESGVVADKDIFADGLDPASGEAITAPLNGLTNLGGADPVGNVGKKLWELLGLTQAQSAAEGAYDLAITANTVGSAAGTVSGFFWYILG